jgi:hypothetical protein
MQRGAPTPGLRADEHVRTIRCRSCFASSQRPEPRGTGSPTPAKLKALSLVAVDPLALLVTFLRLIGLDPMAGAVELKEIPSTRSISACRSPLGVALPPLASRATIATIPSSASRVSPHVDGKRRRSMISEVPLRPAGLTLNLRSQKTLGSNARARSRPCT